MATDPVMKIVPPYTPELLSSVQKVIEEFLSRSGCAFVLEVGSGWSTVWLAHHAELVHSVEHDREWKAEVDGVIDGLNNVGGVRVELVLPDRMADYVGRSEDLSTYDLILIDCVDDARLPVLFASLTRLSDHGWLVVDDSHWTMFDGVIPVMKNLGYQSRILSGQHTRKTGEVCYHQTTIFCKKGF